MPPKGENGMIFDLPPLPYQLNALEPYISESTMEYHYGKHHKAYVDNLNKLIKGTKFENMTLEDIIVESAKNPEYSGVFNNAAQTWNHTFFWNTMQPNGGKEPTGELKKKIDRDFGSYDNFRSEFTSAATSQFGSGWAWLAEDKNGKLQIMKTANGDNPVAHGLIPIIGLDVWEHAYYLDYQNRRVDYINNYLNHLIKWN